MTKLKYKINFKKIDEFFSNYDKEKNDFFQELIVEVEFIFKNTNYHYNNYFLDTIYDFTNWVNDIKKSKFYLSNEIMISKLEESLFEFIFTNQNNARLKIKKTELIELIYSIFIEIKTYIFVPNKFPKNFLETYNLFEKRLLSLKNEN